MANEVKIAVELDGATNLAAAATVPGPVVLNRLTKANPRFGARAHWAGSVLATDVAEDAQRASRSGRLGARQGARADAWRDHDQ
jgi:predicted fused transcriptional regulator/phosphomethylpyrimidine kinase